jgi:hypothetical protein
MCLPAVEEKTTHRKTVFLCLFFRTGGCF